MPPEPAERPGSLKRFARSWMLSLTAERKSPRTIEVYGEATRLFDRFLTTAGRSTQVADITRDDVRAFLAHLHAEGRRPATVQNRYRALRVFFGWLEAEQEITTSPMNNIKPPTVPEEPVAVVTDAQLRALFETCDDPSFEAKRDLAISPRRRRGIPPSVPAPSAPGQPRPSTGTYASETSTPSPTPPGCGSAGKGRSAPTVYGSCCNAEEGWPGCPTFTPTSSDTPSPTSGSRPAATKATSCGSPAGGPGRWSTGTPRRPPTKEPAKHTPA